MTYPIERRAGEIERLHIQAAAMAPDCSIMLDRIGVNAGWRCLDLGCGPGGITALLSECVGPAGRVVGFDADEAFLEHARRTAAPNVMFVAGDDADARRIVLALAGEIGFEGVSAGPLSMCRYLEPLAMLWVLLANAHGLGQQFAFSLIHR